MYPNYFLFILRFCKRAGHFLTKTDRGRKVETTLYQFKIRKVYGAHCGKADTSHIDTSQYRSMVIFLGKYLSSDYSSVILFTEKASETKTGEVILLQTLPDELNYKLQNVASHINKPPQFRPGCDHHFFGIPMAPPPILMSFGTLIPNLTLKISI